MLLLYVSVTMRRESKIPADTRIWLSTTRSLVWKMAPTTGLSGNYLTRSRQEDDFAIVDLCDGRHHFVGSEHRLLRDPGTERFEGLYQARAFTSCNPNADCRASSVGVSEVLWAVRRRSVVALKKEQIIKVRIGERDRIPVSQVRVASTRQPILERS
jgi:hypothetical protein